MPSNNDDHIYPSLGVFSSSTHLYFSNVRPLVCVRTQRYGPNPLRVSVYLYSDVFVLLSFSGDAGVSFFGLSLFCFYSVRIDIPTKKKKKKNSA